MKPRLDAWKVAPGVLQAMMKIQDHVNNSGLEKSMLELVKIRASQINHCAFCLHMHTRDARAAGETNERIDMVAAWRDSPLYTERERAALAWTESLTLVADTHAPDEDYELLRASFSEEEMVELTLAITTINAWNRFQCGFRAVHPMKVKNAVAA